MKNSYSRKRRGNFLKGLISFLVLVMLSASILALYSQGFKDFNPYGWFDKYVNMDVEYSLSSVDISGNKIISNNSVTSESIKIKDVDKIEFEKNDKVIYKLHYYGGSEEELTFISSTDSLTNNTTEFLKDAKFIVIEVSTIDGTEIPQDKIDEYVQYLTIKK